MKQTLYIPIRLPSLNEIIAMRERDEAFRRAMRGRAKRVPCPDGYTIAKKRLTEQIGNLARAELVPVAAARISSLWILTDRRTDPCNIVAGGRKFVLDGIVVGGILGGDGWRYILPPFIDHWERGPEAGVYVTLLSGSDATPGCGLV
jgi:hypothetical protein